MGGGELKAQLICSPGPSFELKYSLIFTSTHWEKGRGRGGGSAAFLATLSALGPTPSPRGYEKTRQDSAIPCSVLVSSSRERIVIARTGTGCQVLFERKAESGAGNLALSGLLPVTVRF